MKNKDFFHLQYDKISWENQEKTKINEGINNYILKEIVLPGLGKECTLFDIGFGIGFFLSAASTIISGKGKRVVLSGCEPSLKNYQYFLHQGKIPRASQGNFSNSSFLNVGADGAYDFVIAEYVFPHFLSDDMDKIATKIKNMLKKKGKFILVVANEKYLSEKIVTKRDLFIEENFISFDGKKYREILHYTDIPKIGKVIDYNREERYYEDVFSKNGLRLMRKENINDQGFVCTLFVFEK